MTMAAPPLLSSGKMPTRIPPLPAMKRNLPRNMNLDSAQTSSPRFASDHFCLAPLTSLSGLPIPLHYESQLRVLSNWTFFGQAIAWSYQRSEDQGSFPNCSTKRFIQIPQECSYINTMPFTRLNLWQFRRALMEPVRLELKTGPAAGTELKGQFLNNKARKHVKFIGTMAATSIAQVRMQYLCCQ